MTAPNTADRSRRNVRSSCSVRSISGMGAV
jgi:hypothetical protein